MSGYLKSAHAIAEEAMKKEWTAKRQWQWASAGFRERLRQGVEALVEAFNFEMFDCVNGLDRLRAKWPLAERRYWTTFRKVDAEREEFKFLHLWIYLRQANNLKKKPDNINRK